MLELPLAERELLEPDLSSGAMFLTLGVLPAKTMSTAGLSVLAKHTAEPMKLNKIMC